MVAMYRDDYGNELTFGKEDLMAGSVKSSLCRRCGEWYRWDETHVDVKYDENGGCYWRYLRRDWS